MEDIETILNERGKTHGDYSVHASTTQDLKEAMQRRQGWHRLSSSQRETLEMIALKIGRILAGDPNYKDHWDDIAGYSTLISKQLTPHPRPEKQPASTTVETVSQNVRWWVRKEQMDPAPIGNNITSSRYP